MSGLGAEALAKEIASALFWRRETAQRILVERQEAAAIPVLRGFVTNDATSASTLIASLHTLDQLAALQPRDLMRLVTHRDVTVRLHALRLGEKWLAKEEGRALLDAVLAAAGNEADPRVAIQFALSLGEARDPRAFAILASYARARLDIRWMDAALLSSLHARGGEMLDELLRTPAAAAPFLDQLAATVAARNHPVELSRALRAIGSSAPERQIELLASLAKGRANAKREPLADATAIQSLAALLANASPEVRAAARMLEDTFGPAPPDRETVAGLPAPSPAVSEETFRRYVAALSQPRDLKRGHELFLQACALCHRVGDEGAHFGPDLMGELGVAEETLVRHLLLPSERIRPGFETTLVETRARTSLTGLLQEDGATSLTLRQPGGVEQVVLRKVVQGVRRTAVSLMPSFAEGLQPADVANLLAWLRSNLKPQQPGRALLFDDDPGFAALLKEGEGRAEVLATRPYAGALCLSITPPQRFSARIPGWKYRIVERPSAANRHERTLRP